MVKSWSRTPPAEGGRRDVIALLGMLAEKGENGSEKGLIKRWFSPVRKGKRAEISQPAKSRAGDEGVS